jgi:hypothetical protein
VSERVLSRQLATEMSVQEVEAVSGAGCYPTPNTVCTTWEYGQIDHPQCDGGIDCDF